MKSLRMGVLALLVLFFCQGAAADSDACSSLTPASIGGPTPRDANTMVIRWLANSNYEIAYRGKVYLFDTYYDRKARTNRWASRRHKSVGPT